MLNSHTSFDASYPVGPVCAAEDILMQDQSQYTVLIERLLLEAAVTNAPKAAALIIELDNRDINVDLTSVLAVINKFNPALILFLYEKVKRNILLREQLEQLKLN